MGLDPGNPFGFGDPPTSGNSDYDFLYTFIIYLFDNLLLVATYIWNTIVRLVKLLSALFSTLRKFLLHLWQQYVKKAIQWLAAEARKVRAWLKRTLTPIIARLEKIKKWYDTHILKQQLRLYQQIQTIRRFLGILRLFHVAWAAKLDQALSDVQLRIEQDIAFIRGTLNQLINTLALTLDPTLFIRGNVLGGTLLGNLAAVKRIFGFSWHGPMTAQETTFLDSNVNRYQEKTAGNHIAALASTGLSPYDQSERADSRKGISDATGAPLPF
jgi:hypothetical protein